MKNVPVIPGKVPPCAACGASETRTWNVVEGIEMMLCFDFLACMQRVRGGASPESFAAGLRGEILAVAP